MEAIECGGESGNGYKTETGTETRGMLWVYERHHACGGSLSHCGPAKWEDGQMGNKRSSRSMMATTYLVGCAGELE